MMFMGGMLAMVLVVVLVVALVAALTSNGFSGPGDHGGDRAGEDAERVLTERYAAGQIDEQELHARRSELRRSARRSGRSAPWGLIAGAGALVALIAVLLVVGTGMGPGWWGHMGHMGFSDGSSDASSEPVTGAEEVTVRAGDLWFEPQRIEATADSAINITVRNDGEVFHDLTIDELDLMIDVEAGDTVTAGITDAEPGSYDFYCSVPGHAQAGMTGTLVVDPAA